MADLSSPEGRSVNDGIDEGCCSLLYVSTHDQTRAIRSSCQGAMLAKVDIRNTHRIVNQMTGGYWGCHGKERYMWTQPSCRDGAAAEVALFSYTPHPALFDLAHWTVTTPSSLG